MLPRVVVIGAAGYALITFPLAYVWHLVAFRELYFRLGYFGRADPIVALGLVAIVLQGVLLSWIYPHIRSTCSWWRRGLRFGLYAGVFLWSSQVLAAAAKHRIEPIPTWIAVETAYFSIQFPIIGLAMGWVHRRTEV